MAKRKSDNSRDTAPFRGQSSKRSTARPRSYSAPPDSTQANSKATTQKRNTKSKKGGKAKARQSRTKAIEELLNSENPPETLNSPLSLVNESTPPAAPPSSKRRRVAFSAPDDIIPRPRPPRPRQKEREDTPRPECGLAGGNGTAEDEVADTASMLDNMDLRSGRGRRRRRATVNTTTTPSSSSSKSFKVEKKRKN